jgi:hypothetical protein
VSDLDDVLARLAALDIAAIDLSDFERELLADAQDSPAGTSSDGASRIRTADLLGAIRAGEIWAAALEVSY